MLGTCPDSWHPIHSLPAPACLLTASSLPLLPPAAMSSTAWLRNTVEAQPEGPSEALQEVMRAARLDSGEPPRPGRRACSRAAGQRAHGLAASQPAFARHAIVLAALTYPSLLLQPPPLGSWRARSRWRPPCSWTALAAGGAPQGAGDEHKRVPPLRGAPSNHWAFRLRCALCAVRCALCAAPCSLAFSAPQTAAGCQPPPPPGSASRAGAGRAALLALSRGAGGGRAGEAGRRPRGGFWAARRAALPPLRGGLFL